MAFRPAALLIVALVIAAPKPAAAQGNLVIAPKRVELEGRTRSAAVTVINQGSETATYRIFFKNQRMTPEGGLEEIAANEGDVLTADQLVRYSPREVTLAPGASQSVRLLLRKPGDLANGEYRSHLFFQTVPPPNSGVSLEESASDGKSITVALIPVYGISIPVIVRHGDLSAAASLSIESAVPTEGTEPPQVRLELGRTGDRSLYGDIEITHVSANGDETSLARTNGIAIYTPLATRTITVGIDDEKASLLKSGGRLVARYLTQSDKPETLAEAEKPL